MFTMAFEFVRYHVSIFYTKVFSVFLYLYLYSNIAFVEALKPIKHNVHH